MKRIYRTAFSLAVFLGAQSIRAADTSFAASAAPSKISWSGFIDVYYSKNFNNPYTRTNQLRNFDVSDNQFALSLAELVVQEQARPVGFRVDLDFGTSNDIVQGLPNPTNALTLSGSSVSTLNVVQQAFLTTVIPVGSGLTVDAGKFVTHMGNEVIEAKDNWNYSRSFLFAYAIPYYHTGVRLTYPVANNFTAALHIVNGWNSVIDNNSSKSFGIMLNYTPSSSTGIVFNGMFGHENFTPIEIGVRNVYDFIVSQQCTDALSIVLNADYGEAGTSAGLMTWKGTALYAKYVIDPKSTAVVRGEVFYDPNDYTTGASFLKATFSEVTLTYEYRPFDALILRGEFRDDFANSRFFTPSSVTGNLQSSQPTFLVGAITIF